MCFSITNTKPREEERVSHHFSRPCIDLVKLIETKQDELIEKKKLAASYSAMRAQQVGGAVCLCALVVIAIFGSRTRWVCVDAMLP